jgi:predicted RecA/RadA family phage recombinase
MAQATFRNGCPLFVDYTPSGSSVSAGDVVVIGDSTFIAHADIPNGRKGALAASGGVYRVVAGGAIAQGKKAYWDSSAHKVVAASEGNTPIGFVAPGSSAAADGDVIEVIHLP